MPEIKEPSRPEYKVPRGQHVWRIGYTLLMLTAKCKVCNLELMEVFIGHNAYEDLYAWSWRHNNTFEYPLSCEEVKMNQALE